MADGIYATPGGAVANAIQQILLRRREEARQGMLDKLGIDKFQADERHRQFERDLQTRQEDRHSKLTDAQIAEAEARRLGAEIGMLPREGFDVTEQFRSSPLYEPLLQRQLIRDVPGEVPRVGLSVDFQIPEGATPEQIEAYEKQLESTGTPGMEMAQAGPQGPSRQRFIGSPDFQREEAARRRLQEFIQNHPTLSQNAELSEALGMVMAGAVDKLPDAWASPKPSFTPIDPNTGRPGQSIELPRGGNAGFRPHPPSAYTPSYTPWNTANGAVLIGNRVGPDGKPSVIPMGDVEGLQRVGTNLPSMLDISNGLKNRLADINTRNASTEEKEAATQDVENQIVLAEGGLSSHGQGLAMVVLDEIRAEVAAGNPPPSAIRAVEEYRAAYPEVTDQELERIRQLVNIVAARYYRVN